MMVRMLALSHWDFTKLMYLRLEKAQTALNRCAAIGFVGQINQTFWPCDAFGCTDFFKKHDLSLPLFSQLGQSTYQI